MSSAEKARKWRLARAKSAAEKKARLAKQKPKPTLSGREQLKRKLKEPPKKPSVRIPGDPGRQLERLGYGVADLTADYGTAISKDLWRMGVRRRAPKETPKLVAKDALRFVGAVTTAIPEPKWVPKELRKKRVAFDPERFKVGRGSEFDPSLTPSAGEFWKKDYIAGALMVAPVVSAVGRRASTASLRTSMKAANPTLSKSAIARAARKESKAPGYAAAQGIKGGIKPRTLEGEVGVAQARPWSRTPLGRAGQRAFDRTSAKIEATRGPGAKFSTSQRAATMHARALRKERWQGDAAIRRQERIIRKALGRKGKDKTAWEALLATMEAPSGMTARQAVEAKITDLARAYPKMPGSEETAARLAQQITALRRSLDGDLLESAEFRESIKAATRLSTALGESAKRTLGMTDEQLASRTNRVAERWEERGYIPRQPGTKRARTLEEAETRLAELEAWEGNASSRFTKSAAYDPRRANIEQDVARQRMQRMARNKNLKRGKEKLHPAIEQAAYGSTRQQRVAFQASTQFDDWVTEMLKQYPENASLKEARSRLDELDSLRSAVAAERERGTFLEGMTTPREGATLGTVDVPGAKIPARARGFWPHRSIFEHVSEKPVTGPMRSGKVVGVSQLGREFARKENKLALYESGLVESNPRVLSNTLRRRLSTEQKVSARDYLYEFGKDIREGGTITTRPGERLIFIRNPAVSRRKPHIPEDVRRAVDDPEGKTLTRGGMDEAAEMGLLDDWIYVSGHGEAPKWTRDLKNVRVIPEGVASTMLPEVFGAQVHGPVQASIGVLNAAARATTIYTPFFGARYIVRNTPQNMILLALTQPKAFGKLNQSIYLLRRSDPDLYGRIKVEVGDVPASAGLPDLIGPERGRIQRFERRAVEGSRRWAGALGEVSDEPWRVASWMQYADDLGFKGPAKWRELMTSDDPAVARLRNDIAQRVRDDMIDFDALTPFERETLSSSLFIYPFVRGALKWPAMYAREYPVRTAVASLLAAQHMREKNPDRKPSALEMGRTEIGGDEIDLGWLSPIAPAIGSAEDILNIVRAIPKSPYDVTSAIARSFAAPQYREAITPSGSWERAARTFIPGYSTVSKIAQGGTDLGEQALRFVGSSVDYKELSPRGKAKERIGKDREAMLAQLTEIAPQYVRDGKMPPGLEKVWARATAVEIVRSEARAKYVKGEPYARAALDGEIDLLVRWGFYTKEQGSWLKKRVSKASKEEVEELRDYFVQNLFDDAYLRDKHEVEKYLKERK